MAEGFALEVVTPERQLLATDAGALVLRTTEGDMTVLDGHISLVAVVVPGVVRAEPVEGEPVRLAVHGGFLQVDTGPAAGDEGGTWATRVTLLAGVAELADEIDVERARQARERAGALAEVRPGEGSEGAGSQQGARDEASDALARAQLRLEVAGQPA